MKDPAKKSKKGVKKITVRVREGATVRPPKPLKRKGFKFLGWFAAKKDKKKQKSKRLGTITVTRNTKVFARWKKQ